MPDYVLAPFVVALAMLYLGERSWRGRLRFRHWAGLRTPSIMKSEQTWVAAHRVGGPWLFLGGVAGVLVCGRIALAGAPISSPYISSTLVFAMEAVFVLTATLRGVVVARDMIESRESEEDDTTDAAVGAVDGDADDDGRAGCDGGGDAEEQRADPGDDEGEAGRASD